MSTPPRITPVLIEIIRNGVIAVTEEMKTNLMRTAYNMIIYEALDFTVGLFTRDGRRTMTVRCKTDVHTAVIDYDQFKELYFQNPQFGFRLLHLIVARLQANAELARAQTATAPKQA